MVTDRKALLLRSALLAGLALATTGCGTLYVAQAARGEIALLGARRPLERVIGDPHTAEPVRRKLLTVQDARAFAVSGLGLPDNASYRSYADIGRPYVVWNVVAAPEFSVGPLRWCFPVVGCVSYRGYFHESGALAFARSQRAAGRDAFVGGVPAFSTLGRFADPILSSMIGYADVDLAALVFHELAHQVVYVRGESEFDEAFAVTVEEAGVQRWLAAGGREGELGAWQRRRWQQRQFVALLADGRARLRALYAQPLAPALMRERKQAELATLAEGVRELERRFGVRTGYREWLEQGLNNAHLASVGTYFDCLPGFERLLAQRGGDLPRFYAAVRELARGAPGARRELCAAAPAQSAEGLAERNLPSRASRLEPPR